MKNDIKNCFIVALMIVTIVPMCFFIFVITNEATNNMVQSFNYDYTLQPPHIVMGERYANSAVATVWVASNKSPKSKLISVSTPTPTIEFIIVTRPTLQPTIVLEITRPTDVPPTEVIITNLTNIPLDHELPTPFPTAQIFPTIEIQTAECNVNYVGFCFHVSDEDNINCSDKDVKNRGHSIITVIGDDVFALDRDSDGEACER